MAESAELIEAIADDADAETDDAAADADADADAAADAGDSTIFTIVCLYYNTWMFNINNKRTNERMIMNHVVKRI